MKYKHWTTQTRAMVPPSKQKEQAIHTLSNRAYFESLAMDFTARDPDRDKHVYLFKNGVQTGGINSNNVFPDGWQDNIVDGEYLYNDGVDEWKRVELYTPWYFAEFLGYVTLGEEAKRVAKLRPDIYKNLEYVQGRNSEDLNNADFVIPKINWGNKRPTKISRLENVLSFLDYEADEFYVKPYSNFDESLTEKSEGTQTTASEVSITGQEGCINPGTNSCQVDFTENADSDNDYAEFYLDISSLQGINPLAGSVVEISIDKAGSERVYPKYIQLITLQENGNIVYKSPLKDISKFSNLKTFEFSSATGFYESSNFAKKLIIRFIGMEYLYQKEIDEDLAEGDLSVGEGADIEQIPFKGGRYVINDISMYSSSLKDSRLPYLHKGADQKLHGDLIFDYGKYPKLKSIHDNDYNLAVNDAGKFVKQVNNSDVNNELQSPELIDSDDTGKENGIKMRTYLKQILSNFSASRQRILGSLDFQPQIFRLGTSDSEIPTDPFFNNSQFRGTGVCIADGSNGWVMVSPKLARRSIAFRKVSNGSYAGPWTFIWDSEHLTKAQYDSFIKTAQVSLSKVVTKSSDYVAKSKEIILVDTTAANVTITLPDSSSATKVSIIKIAGDNKVLVDAVGGADVNNSSVFEVKENTLFTTDGNAWFTLSNSESYKPDEDLGVKKKTTLDSETKTIVSVPINDYDAISVDIKLKKGADIALYNLKAVHNGTDASHTTNGKVKLGDVTDVTENVIIENGFLKLKMTSVSDNWEIKTITKKL